jgi:hypothetical protein
LVCRVDMTRCPVIDAYMAMEVKPSEDKPLSRENA